MISPARALLSDVVHRYRDTDGRPLGEHRVADLYSQVETTLQRCPYRDSRRLHALPMNTSALKQMTRSWSPVVATLGLLSSEYARREGLARLGFFDLWRVTQLGLALPVYLARRARAPVSEEAMPVLVAAVYKVLLGISSSVAMRAIGAEVVQGVPGARWLAPASWLVPAADRLYASIDTGRELIGRSEVCAGPPLLIQQALDALIAPKGAGHGPMASPLADLVPDFDAFYRFGIESAELLLAQMAFVVASRHAALAHGVPRGGLRRDPDARALADRLAAIEQKVRRAQRGQVTRACRALDPVPSPVVGLVLQALHRRSHGDLPQLGTLGPPARGVRGELTARLARVADPTARGPGATDRYLARAVTGYLRFETAHRDLCSTRDRALAEALGTPPPPPMTDDDLVAFTGATLRAPLQALVSDHRLADSGP